MKYPLQLLSQEWVSPLAISGEGLVILLTFLVDLHCSVVVQELCNLSQLGRPLWACVDKHVECLYKHYNVSRFTCYRPSYRAP